MEVFDEEWKPASKPPHPPFLMVYGMVAPLRMYCVAFFFTMLVAIQNLIKEEKTEVNSSL